MKANAREPSRDELLAMAYVDGELAPDAAAEFEGRLADEAHLGLHVAEFKKLELMARQLAPPEPADHEWLRLGRDPAPARHHRDRVPPDRARYPGALRLLRA